MRAVFLLYEISLIVGYIKHGRTTKHYCYYYYYRYNNNNNNKFVDFVRKKNRITTYGPLWNACTYVKVQCGFTKI